MSALASLLFACTGNSGRDTTPPTDPTPSPTDSGDSGTPATDSGTEPPPEPVILYVDDDADPSAGDGTAGDPFGSIQAAFDAAEELLGVEPKPALTIEIAGGSYAQGGVLWAGGTADAPVTVRGSIDDRPLLSGGLKLATGIYLYSEHAVVEGLAITGFTNVGISIATSHVVVRNNLIQDIGCCGKGTGIASVDIDRNTDIVVESNTLVDTGLVGIGIENADRAVVRSNVLLDTGSLVYDPITMIAVNDSTAVVVDHNYLRDDGTKVGAALSVTASEGVVLRRNLVVDASEHALAIADNTGPIAAAHNTLVNLNARSRTKAMVSLSGEGLFHNNLVHSIDAPLVDLGKGAGASWAGNLWWSEANTAPFTSEALSWEAWGVDTDLWGDGDLVVGTGSRPAAWAPSSTSPAYDSAGFLATVESAGPPLELEQTSALTGGMGLVTGDAVLIGGTAAQVVEADGTTVTLESKAGRNGDGITFAIAGGGPDIGAIETDSTSLIGNGAPETDSVYQ